MGTGTIHLTAKHNPTQFILAATPPKVVIGGVEHDARWGETSFQVEPGGHEVEVYYPYLGRKSGAARVTVNVPVGGAASLRYKPSLLVTSPGKLTVG